MRLTVLVDNTPGPVGTGFEAEHGFAAAVEREDRLIIFDTGASDLVVRNAARAGIDLDRAEVVALSHGHYDHTGGLKGLLAAAAPVRLVGHPAAFEPKFVRRGDDLRQAGIGIARTDLEDLGAHIETNTEPRELVPGVWLTGFIPRRTEYETVPAAFVVRRGGELVADQMPDDQALFVRGKEGIVVVAGCAHAGLVNTLRRVRELVRDEPIVAVFGGAHLGSASEDRIERTIAFLREMDLRRVGLCHCTGERAVNRIAADLGDRFLHVHSGFSLEL